jgi:hypothetical protein
MGGKAKPPPPPDYSQIAAASERAAELNFQLGREQLSWAREQYFTDRSISDRVVDSFLGTMEQNQRTAMDDRARYERVYQGLEDQLVADAQSYSSPQRREMEVGAAQSAVAQQFDQARMAATQNLESFGIDPSSTRYAALDMGMRAQQGAAQAAAGTQANRYVDSVGRALRSEALNIGKGYPGQIAGAYGTALNAGSGAINGQLGTTASGANTMGTAPQYQGLGNQSLGTWGNVLNQGYQNQLGYFNASNQGSSGWGTALGMVGSAAIRFLNDGGPVEQGATPGGRVPAGASPTGGQAIDDVPAALTAGEFVIPKDVTTWLGEKTMHQLIEKARKEQQELPQRSGAIPSTGPAPAQDPTFASRPQGALPVG